MSLESLREKYLQLVNTTLPKEINSPVRFNHCFARIALDWLFQDVWYNHIEKRPAYKTLNEQQLKSVIQRMESWRSDRTIIVADNRQSLIYRGKL